MVIEIIDYAEIAKKWLEQETTQITLHGDSLEFEQDDDTWFDFMKEFYPDLEIGVFKDGLFEKELKRLVYEKLREDYERLL